MHKGYFPHNFNTPENQNKIFETIPPIDMYGDKFMSINDHEDFIKRHSQQNGVFNFQEEL
jgi:hypothetical protein